MYWSFLALFRPNTLLAILYCRIGSNSACACILRYLFIVSVDLKYLFECSQYIIVYNYISGLTDCCFISPIRPCLAISRTLLTSLSRQAVIISFSSLSLPYFFSKMEYLIQIRNHRVILDSNTATVTISISPGEDKVSCWIFWLVCILRICRQWSAMI